MLGPPVKLPKKEDINKPEVALKAFFWDKLRDNEMRQGVLWIELGKHDIKFDQNIMATLLEGFKPKPKVDESAAPKAPPKPTVIQVLDAKKSQQIGIAI